MKATSIIGLGLVCFVILAILTILLVGRWIEDNLAKSSIDDLKAAGQDWALVSMDGRDATLRGAAPDSEAAKSAYDVVSNTWGIRTVIDETSKP